MSASPPFPLVGKIINSETIGGVSYHLERGVGEGGMGTAYLARRESDGGSSPVVIKVMREDLAGGEIAAGLIALKETVALSRLNESLPPTPFVVRFVDSGSAPLFGDSPTPWTAIEYVHGGIEGTTLEDRVTYSVHKTGYAFDGVRAAHTLRCLAAGLSSIHAVGVIHRDLTPGNVLCCGFGTSEMFKIADFGVARASGIDSTFGDLCLGTIGYSAPEAPGQNAGPATDVFALAAVMYYVLTGQRYFTADDPVGAVHQILCPRRQRVADHETLVPDLAHAPEICESIDAALAQATALDPKKRHETPARFAADLLACLGEQQSGPRSSRKLVSAVQSSRRGSGGAYTFTVRSRRQASFAIRSAAWNADSHALALFERGGAFWNGDTWLDAAPLLSKLPGPLAFTQRSDAGGWLVGGDAISVVGARGVEDTLSPPGGRASFVAASGRLDDLLLAAGADASGACALWPVSARRFLRPIPLPGIEVVNTVQRLDDTRFLVGGRSTAGSAFAACVSPLDWHVEVLEAPSMHAFIAGAAAPERATALLTGTAGVVWRQDGSGASTSVVPGEPVLTAAATDILGREWVSGTGCLWTRDAHEGDTWSVAWRDAEMSSPFVSLFAEPGLVLAMTVDGSIVEGRAPV